MISRIVRHVHASTAIAFAALVLSISGGAFALGAQNGGPGTKPPPGGTSSRHTTAVVVATASKKSKTKVGPRGPAGPRGASGPAGATGPAGAAGSAGAKGENGSPGTPGGPGEKGSQGEKGLQGEKGEQGPAGTIGKTLPSKATETGAWSLTAKKQDEGTRVIVPLSFPIPMESDESKTETPMFDENHVHFFAEGEVATAGNGCGAGSGAKPEAEPGNVCVYATNGGQNGVPITSSQVQFKDPSFSGGELGAGATGALLYIEVPTGFVGGTAEGAAGTWAVSAP